MSFEEHIPNERLRRTRHLKGWTQSQLAEILDTDFETVSRWERGISMPSAYFREKLCSVLDKTPAELGLIQDLNEPLAASTSPCVFLAAAYADAEREFTTGLKAHLQARGVIVLSSRTLRRQGVENQRRALQEAIRTAQAVLLIASPEARSSRHVQKALQMAGIYRSPVCGVWIDGKYWQECVPPDCGELFATIDVRKNNDHRMRDEIVAILEEVWLASNETAVSINTTTESAKLLLEPRNPYKGLRAFHSEDRHDFFGRDTLVDELADALDAFLIADEKHVQSARLLAIVGPSGSGKSSVVMAGLLPRLQMGGLPGSQQWVYLDPMIPGAHPIDALALALAKQVPDMSLTTLRDDLDDDSAFGLHLLASLLRKLPETRVVLFIDQFEEVFTQTTSEEERRQFFDLLVAAITEPQGPTVLILTLRADFYDRPMHYLELFRLIEAHHSFVLPLDLKGLREVIEKPAELPDVRLTFEDDLASDLLFEVQEQVGSLPLLQFTLDQLFQLRIGHQLTLQAYRETGGVKGAVAKHAETTYATLPSEEHRKLARVLFLRLIDPGITEQDTTRRRASLSEFSLTDTTQSRLLRETIDAFIAARLVTTNEFGRITTIEVSHEALIREWSRLAMWLREAHASLFLQKGIREDAAAWERSGRSVDRLYRGDQLEEALEWKEHSLPSSNEDAFLQASIAEREQQWAAALEQQQQQRRYKRRTVLVGLGVGLVGLGLAGTVFALSSIFQSKFASPPLILPYIFSGHDGPVTSVAWSPDGKYLASASYDDTVRIWDTSTGTTLRTYTGHMKQVNDVSWSPDGKRIASAGVDVVQVWDASTGTTLYTYSGHDGPVTSVAWSPDGKHLASASYDGTVRVFNASTGTTLHTYTGHTDQVLNVAWSPDSKYVASASGDRTVRVWDATTGETLHTYTGHTDRVLSVAWSPNGKYVASAGADKTAQVRDVTTGTTLHTYTGHTQEVLSVAWSPNGKYVASASSDHTMRMWDAITGTTQFTYTDHTGAVLSVAWSPDGKYLASAGADDTVQVWNASTGTTLRTYKGHTQTVTSVAWSPDGKHLASTSYDFTVQVWDATTGTILLTHWSGGWVPSVAWSPDGKYVASTGTPDVTDATTVWDATTGTTLHIYRGDNPELLSVAWSPDGKYLASAGIYDTVQVWNASTGTTLFTYKEHTNSVTCIAWSPDGKHLASASYDHTVRVWDASTGRTLRTYTGHSGAVLSVAWSPDGKHLASAGIDSTVQVEFWLQT